MNAYYPEMLRVRAETLTSVADGDPGRDDPQDAYVIRLRERASAYLEIAEEIESGEYDDPADFDLNFGSPYFLLGYLEGWADEDTTSDDERNALLAAVALIERGLK